MSDARRELVRRGQLRSLRKGSLIIIEGDRGDTLFIVLQGQLRAFSTDSLGRELTYMLHGPGDLIGDMGLDGGTRAASVQAMQASVCAVVSRQTLEQYLQQSPGFALEMLIGMISRCRRITQLLKGIAMSDVYSRLKALLERLAVAQDDGTALAYPAPSHLEMSQSLGCSREMVSRLMKDLQRGGYVEASRRRVLLRRPLPAHW